MDNYLIKHLPIKPTKKEKNAVIAATYREFPELLEYYIRYKEDTGGRAKTISEKKVEESRRLYILQVAVFANSLNSQTDFYKIAGTTLEEARARVMFLKDVIENKDGYKVFYSNGRPIKKESDLQILYRLTWYGTLSDVNREVNNGRGPADFVVSRGSQDKSLVELKIASNTHLKRNLENQVAIYQKASNAQCALKVILFFTRAERQRVERILRELKLDGTPDIILIDARKDNKPSASKAGSSTLTG